jgi:uncharacterized membrane protein YsdA (DUF1294 family)
MKIKYLTITYAGLANAGAFGLFAYDKRQAIKHQWRIPEKTLHLTALLGGWIGGLAAMSTFRHKSKKKAFQIPYFTCVAANIGLCGAAVMGFKRNPNMLLQLKKRL